MKKTYFKFYNKLPEPIRTWAKENWDDRYNDGITPKNLYDAIILGFAWDKTPQWCHFWYFVYHNLDSKTLLADCKAKFPEMFKPAKAKPAKIKKPVSRIKLKIVKRKDGSWMFSPVAANGEKLNDRYLNKSNPRGVFNSSIVFI